MTRATRTPPEIKDDLDHAVRLEWWTIGWQLSIVVVMAMVMGSSQAMKSAWIEDALGLVPATVFLIAVHYEHKAPNKRFPFGYTRLNSLAFLIAATALLFMGGYLIYDSGMKLIAAEHPTIGPVTLLGEKIWLGWLMMAALIYSIIPPVILGRMKQPLSERLSDKVLYTDSLMQKADWMTGLAAIIGIGGVGFGFWWADSAAAILIAFDIAHDGFRAVRIATSELIDGAPRALDSASLHQEAKSLEKALAEQYPGGEVRLRETGRYIAAEVSSVAPQKRVDPKELWPGDRNRTWRFARLTFAPTVRN